MPLLELSVLFFLRVRGLDLFVVISISNVRVEENMQTQKWLEHLGILIVEVK